MGYQKFRRKILSGNEDLNDDTTGWAQYADTSQTSGSPQLISADTDTLVVNDGLNKIENQLPLDIASYYVSNKIASKNGDTLWITIDTKAIPTNANTTYIEFWFDIGGGVGELYRRIVSFPKGNGVLRPINFTVGVYTLDTWEANGAEVWCRANGTASLYETRYVITRTHKSIT